MKNAEKPALFSLGWWREAALLNLGAVLVAMGVYFFKFPNHFTTGGVSGLSILMHRYLPGLTTAMLNLILNLLLLLVGVLCLGRSFGLRTAYATVVSSLATMFFEWALPMSAPMTSQPLLELIFAVALPSVGTALLFQVGASSGGTDVIAMLIKKYSHFNIGTGLALADVTVALNGFPSTNYATHTIINHLNDYGIIRLEMGYACAIAVLLFFMMLFINKIVQKTLGKVGS